MLSATSNFASASEPVRAGITDTLYSGNYRVPPEAGAQLLGIRAGLDRISLDNTFLQSSRQWGDKFDPSALSNEKYGAARTMPVTNAAVNSLRNDTFHETYSELDGNSKGDIHFRTNQNLARVQQEMLPYVNSSVDRIRQFCDHLGVTDRYTGYRHNLTRSQLSPSKMGHAWMEGVQPNSFNRSLNVGWKPQERRVSPGSKSAPPRAGSGSVNPKQTHGTIDSLQVQHSGVRFNTGPMTKSIQEQCGINTTYPGKTEYMVRYMKPNVNTKTSPFVVNPPLDLHSHGRPMASRGFVPKITEYQGRYTWPDGSKMAKLPWLSAR